MGMPGYSGLAPSPMLANALITGREALMAGQAVLMVGQRNRPPPSIAQGQVDLPKVHSDNALRALQPNVRAVLAGQELLQGLTFLQLKEQSSKHGCDRGVLMSYTDDKNALTKMITLHAPNVEFFWQQLALVDSFADLRSERQSEILAQVVPQTAHWAAIAGLDPERDRYTWELLGVGLRFAMTVVMRMKLLLNCPRPVAYSPLIQPMVLTPGYSAYPSGHATEAYFVAEFLPRLMGDATYAASKGKGGKHERAEGGLAAQLNRLAFRVAENRVVAGLHFPVDSIAGQLLGATLARYVIARCEKKDFPTDAEFPNGNPGEGDNCKPKHDDYVDTMPMTKPPDTVGLTAESLVLSYLWREAKKERDGVFA
jgi:membrane-associated phospholipid phosphatase